MPFPQLPSGKDVEDFFKGLFLSIVILFVGAFTYGIYKDVTTEKVPYVSPEDKFKICVEKKDTDTCLQEFRREVQY